MGEGSVVGGWVEEEAVERGGTESPRAEGEKAVRLGAEGGCGGEPEGGFGRRRGSEKPLATGRPGAESRQA
jgi:hypothetical protein